IYDGKINEAAHVIHVLGVLFQEYGNSMPPVLFIANEFGPEAIQILLMNKADPDAKLSLCAVQGPNVTNIRTQQLDDLAVYLGGTRLGNGSRNLLNITMDDIGIADRVVVDKYKTTLFNGHGN